MQLSRKEYWILMLALVEKRDYYCNYAVELRGNGKDHLARKAMERYRTTFSLIIKLKDAQGIE
jgi:hypothetical protein